MAKIGHVCLKKYSFRPFQRVLLTLLVLFYVPYRINDYILANLNFQKNRVILL